VVLLKKAASCDGLIDYSTGLEYEPSDILRRTRGGERSSIFLGGPNVWGKLRLLQSRGRGIAPRL